ncbi:MAG: YvcK family protein [Clostridia bacterium]|nr:YvcK family protein [Clostridia bacterium]
MKGFLEWFKSSSKMKRWMFLILLGVIAICYAISKILVTNKLETVKDVVIIIIGFVIGFVAIIVGLVHMNKRTLELLVEETDKREEENLKSLIFNRKVYSQGPKIVVIGGGTGLNSVLKGLKKYTDNLTAIVTVSDYGEGSTDSRKMLETLPLEDIKESMVALATNEEEMNSLLNYKFEQGRLKSLSFGDIYLLAMQNIYQDFSKSVKQSSEILNITGRVMPVTMEEMTICAELEDGTVVESREEIPEIVNKKSSKINRIYINPTNCRVAPGVAEAIEEADAIIIGPGNLYTNVIPNLLVKGVTRAIKNCKGFKIYISNIMTEPGQTHEYTLSDHIKAIIDHVGEDVIDYCIYDTGEIVPEIIRKYNEEGSELVDQDTSKAKSMGMHLLKRDLATVDGEKIRHNPDAIAASIVELICEDLKFKDMQNNPEYMILNDRLKDKKKKIKKERKFGFNKNNSSDDDKKNEEKKSKFFDKYEERIKSIRESDKKSKRKDKKAKQQLRHNLNIHKEKSANSIPSNAEIKRRRLEESIEKMSKANKNNQK